MLPDSLSDTVVPAATVLQSRDTGDLCDGITGRSSPGPRMVGMPTPTVVCDGRGMTFLPGDNRRPVPHQSPSLNERGRQTERSREGSVTRSYLDEQRYHVLHESPASSGNSPAEFGRRAGDDEQ
jgi:hypothetical protein